MTPKAVCNKCQNYFGSKIEAVALNDYPFAHWRTFGGIRTKKGKVPMFDFFEGTLFGPDTSGIVSIAFHPLFHKALLEGRKTQMRLLAEPSDRNTVCRFLLKMAIELIHEDRIANVYARRFLSARYFARFCRPGSKWWFMLVRSESPNSCQLGISDIGKEDFVFSITNGFTALMVPVVENIIPGDDLRMETSQIHIYRCHP